MTTVLYEHPLNERIRNYLKLEQLFKQANQSVEMPIELAYPVYFNALFAIIDTLERNDIKGDLIKDLEKLEQNLVMWSQSPDVDHDMLNENLKQVVALTATLRVNVQQWWQLKEDKLLLSIKQRFAIQGGSSSFDLPQLQYWLNLPQDKTTSNTLFWLSKLSQVTESLSLVLKFIRQRSPFEIINTDSGFYQDNGEGLLLLRIKTLNSACYYPTISGNRFRYSIRFMLPCSETGKKYSNLPTTFKLARC